MPISSGSRLGTLCFVLCSLFFSVSATAQEDPEYKMEIGGGLGLVSYLGDFNGSPLSNMQPMVSAVAKYRPNPRTAWALSLGYGKLKGDSRDEENWFAEVPADAPVSFSNALFDGGLRFEYNFWAFGTGREYRGAKPLSPFMAIGLGTTYVDTPDRGVFTMNLNLGAGVKYKVGERLNLTAEWRVHFTGSDELDGVSDPQCIKSSGIFKNTDCYSVLQLSLTYDIWAKCKTCNNDRD